MISISIHFATCCCINLDLLSALLSEFKSNFTFSFWRTICRSDGASGGGVSVVSPGQGSIWHHLRCDLFVFLCAVLHWLTAMWGRLLRSLQWFFLKWPPRFFNFGIVSLLTPPVARSLPLLQAYGNSAWTTPLQIARWISLNNIGLYIGFGSDGGPSRGRASRPQTGDLGPTSTTRDSPRKAEARTTRLAAACAAAGHSRQSPLVSFSTRLGQRCHYWGCRKLYGEASFL